MYGYRSPWLLGFCILSGSAVAVAQPASQPTATAPAKPAATAPASAATAPAVKPATAMPAKVASIPPPAQVAPIPPPEDPYGGGIKFNLTKSGKSWVRFIAWTQVWLRMIHNNPGTTVGGEDKDVDFDVALRRVRLLFVGQLTDRVVMLTHFGINNQTFKNNAFTDQAAAFFVHDAWVQFEAIKRHLYLGGGLHYWNGVSRLASGSTLTMLAIDEPILNWPTINSSDQFARWLGIFAKGKIAGFDYRLALDRPFTRGGTDAPVAGEAAKLDANANTWAVQGYFSYQFLDEESSYLPYFVGSYLGKKSVFNVGFGFLYQPEAFHTLGTEVGASVEKHDQLLLGADIFFDKRLGTAGALTAYLGLWYYDMGPERLTVTGIANLAGGKLGNAYPLVGTGKHLYAQAGYLLPESLGVMLQPYFTFQASSYDALEDPAFVIEGGLNWFLIGHHAKVTLHYRARPIFDAANEAAGFRSEIILQGMIFI